MRVQLDIRVLPADACSRSLAILAAATATKYWVDPADGVVTEAPQGIDDVRSAKGLHVRLSTCAATDGRTGMFIRGLYELWARTPSTAAQALIAAFVAVQVSSPVYV